MGRTPYDFENYAYENIQSYVRQFELPRPDPCSERDLLFMLGRGPYVPSTDVNKSHQNHLLARHERWRTFENIRHVSLDAMSPLKWINTALPKRPEKSLNLRMDARYILPENLPKFFSHAPTNIENMSIWLELVFVTATRVLHSTMPRTIHYAFQVGVDNSKDRTLFRHFLWSHNGVNSHRPEWDSGSVVIAYQPPFILTEQDLREFVACNAFPTFDLITTQLSSKHRLWAKMWDTCQANHCSWFILTSYTHWVFGAFSKGMRVAFVSPVITYSRKSPTVLEHFIFWLCSAMRLPGTFRLPQVGDEEPFEPPEIPTTTYDVFCFGRNAVDEPVFAEHDIDMEPITNLPRPPASESYWQGRDDLPESSAGVDLASQLCGEGSIASCYGVADRHQPSVTRGAIRTWLATCQNAAHRRLDEDDLIYRSIPAWELPENTFKEDELRGEWMVPG